MIEEKTRRLKTNRNKDNGVSAKAVKTPIVLLQRLHIGANGAISAKNILTDKHNISGGTAEVTTPKKSELKKPSNTILNSLENGDNTRKHKLTRKQTNIPTSNEESTVQCPNPTESKTVIQSTLTDSNHEVTLSTTKSYKFKKKFKRLQDTQLNKSFKTRSGNKSRDEDSVIIDEKLNEKIKKDPKLDADKTTIRSTEMTSAIATRKKLSGKTDDDKKGIENSNTEKDSLTTNPVQEKARHDVSVTEKVCSSSDNLDDASKSEKTVQVNTSTSTTRSGLLRKTGVNVQNSLQNISSSAPSQAISATTLPTENTSNESKNKISTRNKSREITKTSNACQVEISNEITTMETSKKGTSVNETTDAIVNNGVSNSIQTRSKVQETTKTGSNEKPSILKSTPKHPSNKSSLNKESSNSADIQGNGDVKRSISTRRSEVQVNNKSLSNEKTQDNLKLSLDTAKETSGKSTIPSRNKPLEKVKTNDKKMKTRQSVNGNKTADLLQNSSTPNSSQALSPEETIENPDVSAETLTIKEDKIVKNKTRSKLLAKKKTDGGNDADGIKVRQAGEHTSEMRLGNESSTSEKVIDRSVSLVVDLNKTVEAVSEGKRLSTRSKKLDKKLPADPEKNILENNLLQSKKVLSVVPSIAITSKKSLESIKSSDKVQVGSGSVKTPDNNAKNVIPTRSRLLEKSKVDDNEKLTAEKLSVDTITGSILTEAHISNELSASEKLLDSSKRNSTSTPKKIDTASTRSTRSRVEQKKADVNEKSVENETTSLEQNHATIDCQKLKNSKQSVPPNDTIKDSLKLLTDTANAKENTLSRSHEKKNQVDHEESIVENKVADTKQSQSINAVENTETESTISTRTRKTFEKDKIDDHDNVNLDSSSISPKCTTNSARTPQKIDVKSKISTRSKLVKKIETENREESNIENETVHVEQNHSALNFSQAPQSSNDSSLDAINLQLLPHTVNIDDSANTITTRSGSTKKITNARPLSKKNKALAENQHSLPDESTARQTAKLVNETNNCNVNKQQQVCSKREIVIKLCRCDQDRIIETAERGTPKKNVQQLGKRKREHESIVDEIPKAKKSKQADSNDSNVDLSVPIENQQLAVDNQVPLSAIEDINKPVVESQSSVESNHSDINITEIIENVSENRQAVEEDTCLEDLSNINSADNTDCIAESPEIAEQENQSDNERVENENEITVNSSGDNNSVHEEEMLEDDRDEGISVDTSENETNAETRVNNDDVIVENNTPTIVNRNKESHSLLARKMVEEVINDWAVADDDKTDNIDSAGINEDVSTPEVIQIDDNDDLEVIVDVHQAAVSTETEKNPSHNLISTSGENIEPDSIDISDSPPIEIEKSANAAENKTAKKKKDNDMEKESRESNSTSEHTSDVSEAEDVDDSNFESIDESSCAEIFADENRNEQVDNLPQETITYYNSEDISVDIGAPDNRNTLNDIVMSLKDACDKITADLSAVNTSYENNEESSNQQEPELLFISDDDDSNEIEEEEEDVVILEPQVEINEPPSPEEEQRNMIPNQLQQAMQSSPEEEQRLVISNQMQQVMQPSSEDDQRLMMSNQFQQVMQQGSPSISVVKASELRDEILEPPVEYPIKRNRPPVIVYSQRQMLSTTLLPANIVSSIQNSSAVLSEDSVIQCPKCRCEFLGKSRLRRHWLTCGDMYLYCPCCSSKLKQRRSLIHHLNTQHADQIDKADVIKVVDHIVKQTRETAGAAKIQPVVTFALRDLLRETSTTPVIELPAYIRIQCVVCNKSYDQVPATYKKICDDCSSDLMTAICQLCRKQYMLSTKVAVHVQGNCIFTGRIQCRDCDFISSSKYHLQEHIIRKHIQLDPKDYFACRLGCGKSFRTQDAMKKHERICNKEANLTCRFCNYKTKHRSAMKMHVQQHIVHEKLSIDNDGTVQVFGQQGLERSGTEDEDRDLTTEQQVRSVIRVHCSRCNRTLRLTSNRSSCENCKLSFTFSCSRCPNSVRLDSLHAARLHVIRNHSVKIHECPHCCERFSYVYDLTRHASKCNAKTFKCDQCNYRASEEYKIRQHKRRVHFTDSDEAPLCKKCGKWFNRVDSLKRHENKLCGIEPRLSCEHCQFKTKTKFSLLRHIQSQHAYIYENFSFVCDRCNKFYTNMFAYEDHVKNCHALYKN